jgi:hypothetical protein
MTETDLLLNPRDPLDDDLDIDIGESPCPEPMTETNSRFDRLAQEHIVEKDTSKKESVEKDSVDRIAPLASVKLGKLKDKLNQKVELPSSAKALKRELPCSVEADGGAKKQRVV